MGAQQLQVLNVVAAAPLLRDDVVNLEVAELERRRAPATPALLLAEQHVLVLAVVGAHADLIAAEGIGNSHNSSYRFSALASFSRVTWAPSAERRASTYKRSNRPS